MNMKELKAEKAKADKMLEKNARKAIVGELNTFFKKHPEVEAVKWQGYTPYFNDGDVCEFSMHDFEFKFCEPNKVLSEKEYEEYVGESDGDEDADGECFSSYLPDRISDALIDDLKELINVDDIFLAAFGDHHEVVVTREGFNVRNDIEHD